KKISYVRILFRFRNAQLRLAGRTGDLSENVHQIFRRENVGGRIGHVVLRQRDEMDARPNPTIKPVKFFEEKGLRKLTGAIGAEIEEQNDIVIAHALFTSMGKNQRGHEIGRASW